MPSSRSAQHQHPFIALFCLLLLTTAWSAPLPVARLFEPPGLTEPQISTDGKYVAMRAEIERTHYLALMDLATMQLHLVAKFDEARLQHILWKQNDLLLLIVRNSDGSEEMRTYDLNTQKVGYPLKRITFRQVVFLAKLPQEPDEILLQITTGTGASLRRLNVRTGKFTIVEEQTNDVERWIVTPSGEAFAAVCFADDKYFLLWRPRPAAPWQRRELGSGNDMQLNPIHLIRDQKRLLTWDFSGQTTAVVVALNPETMKTERIFQHPEVNPEEYRAWSDFTEPTAIWFEDDRPRLYFLDAEAAKIQAAIDSALPETVNEVQSASADRRHLVILATSDRNSGIYYLLDRTANRLSSLGPVSSGINPDEMGSSKTFTFSNRDGMKIRGRLLLPPGSTGKAPVILMVGPDLAGPRSRNKFDTEQQILATRGYAVLQIDYRGTDGFGRGFLKAGDYQLASGMVHDLIDGLDFVVAQGWVDGERIGLLSKKWGGVVAAHTLTQSNRFKVWLNRDSYLTDDALSYERLAFSPKKQEEIIADLGGKRKSHDFLESLQPARKLQEINVPSFHVYPRSITASVSSDSRLIKAYLKVLPNRGELIFANESSDPKVDTQNAIDAYEKMLGFLQRHMPPAP